MGKPSGKSENKSLIEKLTTTDRLLVLLLLKLGATQGEIGDALGVTQGTISKNLCWNVKKLALDAVTSGKSDR